MNCTELCPADSSCSLKFERLQESTTPFHHLHHNLSLHKNNHDQFGAPSSAFIESEVLKPHPHMEKHSKKESLLEKPIFQFNPPITDKKELGPISSGATRMTGKNK